MGKIKIIPEKLGWKAMENDSERVKEGVAKMRQALAEDEKRERERPSGLPKDWRNRVIRLTIDPITHKIINPLHHGLPEDAGVRFM